MPSFGKNLNSRYRRGNELLDFTQIVVDVDDKANLEYLPQTVHKIYSTNQPTPGDGFAFDGILTNQFVVLTNQEDRVSSTEGNGLYKQTSATTAVKITPSKDTFFLDVSSEFKRAVYIKEIDNYFTVNFNKVLLGTSIYTESGDTSARRIFNYPVAYSRPATILTNVFGKRTDTDDMFDGEYKVVYFNKSGTSILEMDNFTTTTFRSNFSAMSIPTIDFGTSMGTSGGFLDLTSGAGNLGVSWFIKSEMYF